MRTIPPRIIMDDLPIHPWPLDREVDLSHYLRQATILIRRHSTRINLAYVRRRRPAPDLSSWKP